MITPYWGHFETVKMEFRLVPVNQNALFSKYLGQHQLQQCEITVDTQVGASSRSNPGSNSILGSTFATEIGSNFIIGVRSTTDHWILLIQSEAFSFHFWGNISCVTIHLIGWYNFKTLWRVPEAKKKQENMKISTENTMQKWTYMTTKTHAGAFRDQCEPQKLFANSGSLLETWINTFFCSWFKPFLCAIRRMFSTADLSNDGEIFVVNNHCACAEAQDRGQVYYWCQNCYRGYFWHWSQTDTSAKLTLHDHIC